MYSNKSCSLSIEILPEFGWSIKGQPVYGPGSVFQGYVKLNLENMIPIERVRLAFYAVETIPPFDIVPGSLRVAKRTLFSVQHTLWDSKRQTKTFDLKSNYLFPFTIQMPMVQFPPSCEHSAYKCHFQLIALLDTPSLQTQPVIKTELPVVCMPFVETSVLKSPKLIRAQKGDMSAHVRLGAQEFVPGDLIPLTLHVDKQKGSRKSSIQYVTVSLKLLQILKIVAFDDMQDQVQTVATTMHKLILVDGMYCDADLTLKVPTDITPSYDYGQLVNTSYQLEVCVEQKGPMGGIWNHYVEFDKIDITVGTLGYGIRTSNDLELYTDYTEEPTTMPLPKFMKAIEYEDSLPVYDPAKLPAYENTSPPPFNQSISC